MCVDNQTVLAHCCDVGRLCNYKLTQEFISARSFVMVGVANTRRSCQRVAPVPVHARTA